MATYADLQTMWAQGRGSQLGIAGVLALRGSELALQPLLREVQAGKKTRTVPISGLRLSHVFAADEEAETDKQSAWAGAVLEGMIF